MSQIIKDYVRNLDLLTKLRPTSCNEKNNTYTHMQAESNLNIQEA